MDQDVFLSPAGWACFYAVLADGVVRGLALMPFPYL
jgi:hypothetical protein